MKDSSAAPQNDKTHVILSHKAKDPAVWMTGENNAAMNDG
jgi:hypothetical protein